MSETLATGKGILDEQVLRIVKKEFQLFQAVKNVGGPAVCQFDRDTFTVMRGSQLMAWSPELRNAYESDLDSASFQNRNLMSEKYAHMMQYTFPSEYDEIKHLLPPISKDAQEKIDQIIELILDWSQEMQERFPAIMSVSRPIFTTHDASGISIETYSRGELSTYSEQTLGLLLDYYRLMKSKNINIHEVVNGFTVLFYGHDSLEQAENVLKERYQM